MESIEFTYWLQGFLELSETKTLDERQLQIVRDHLALVFTKVTPDRAIHVPKPKEKSQTPSRKPKCHTPSSRKACGKGTRTPRNEESPIRPFEGPTVYC